MVVQSSFFSQHNLCLLKAAADPNVQWPKMQVGHYHRLFVGEKKKKKKKAWVSLQGLQQTQNCCKIHISVEDENTFDLTTVLHDAINTKLPFLAIFFTFLHAQNSD